MTARRRKVQPQVVDERTAAMSVNALYCRGRRGGCTWVERGKSRRRYNELFDQGLWEDDLVCDNKCGKTLYILYRRSNGEILKEKQGYPSGLEYLLPPGSGRLSRAEARVAYYSRMDADRRRRR